MADRYYSESPIATDRVVLSGPEAHHLIHVMRAKPGMAVTLLDGSGWEFTAVVERVGRADVELAIQSRAEVNRESARELTLAVALPKGERQKWLVEKAVELGVARIVPLVTVRAVAQPTGHALERLRRAVIEASKQCGRNRLMAIAEPLGWGEFLAHAADVPCRLLAHPGGSAGRGTWDVERGEARVIAAVGPEGGFAEEEVSQAQAAGWQAVDLGPRILRVETAAVILAARVL